MSTQLIPVVPAVIGTETVQTVDGRVLHTFLEVEARFNDWIIRRIDEYGFEEDKDFYSFLSKTPQGGRPTKDYTLTLDMAKELSMVERNAKGKQARQYFIECERRALAAARALTQPQPTPSPVRKPIRSRDDLSFTQRDNQGQLQNWVVAYDRNSSWHINVAIGKAYFEEVLELGQHDPAEAQDAVQYALVNGAATNFRPGGWGIECGFAMALAEALFASPSAPKRGITHQKIQPKQLVYQEDACQKVLAAIQGEKQHGMTARGLQQACWTYRRLSADKRAELLNTLIEDEKIVAMVHKGKRALTYVARPFVRTQEIGG